MTLFRLWGSQGETRDNVENPQMPLTAASLVSLLGGTAVEAGVPVTPESSLQMSAVFRATVLVSSLAASMPLVPYAKGTKNATTSLILGNPHPDLTPFELWQLSYAYRCLWGNSYMQKVRNRAGQLTWLYPIQPANVRVGRAKPIEANPSGKIFEVTTENGIQPYTPNEILHLPGFGYDGLTGVSRVRLAAQGIGTAIAAERYSGKLFGSGNLMSGVLQTEQRLENEQAEALQKRWRTKHSGLDHAHEVAVLDSGAKFQPMTIPSKDAELLASRQFSVLEIGRFFGVPPFLMMETEKSTSWGCLPGDAQVSTIDGPKPIEKVEYGDEVWSYTGSGMVLAKVTAFHVTGYKPLLTIRTASRELRLTANHRLPVRRYFGTAEGGDGECGWETIEISAGEVREGDFLLVPWSDTGDCSGDETWSVPDVELQRVISIERGQVAVPVYDITVAEHAHYVADGVVVHNTGLEQQATGFVVFDLHPQWLAPTEQRVSREVVPVGTEVRYNMNSLLRGDSAARAAFYSVMRMTGAYNADEIRDAEDLPPIPDGKGQTYLQPVNMQSLGEPKPATDGSSGGT